MDTECEERGKHEEQSGAEEVNLAESDVNQVRASGVFGVRRPDEEEDDHCWDRDNRVEPEDPSPDFCQSNSTNRIFDEPYQVLLDVITPPSTGPIAPAIANTTPMMELARGSRLMNNVSRQKRPRQTKLTVREITPGSK